MRLRFYTEARLIRDKKGNFYNIEGVQKYDLFKRYLKYFDKIIIVARVLDDNDFVGSNDCLVNGANVEVYKIPYYKGPKEFLMNYNNVINEVKNSICKEDAYLLRIPGIMGNIASYFLKRYSIKYFVEVVGDPNEVFKSKSYFNTQKLYQVLFTKLLRKVVLNSSGALYVTERVLQDNYPVRSECFQIGVSDVKIKKEEILKKDKVKLTLNYPIKIISIGSLEQMYKGADILLKACSVLKKENIDINLLWVGTGKHQPEMEKLALQLGLKDTCDFLGFINNKDKINNFLDESDLFVLASRTEGLPRVIVEAFARGLPVIASNVGGIPELVQKDLLFDVENYRMLADKIKMLLSNKGLYSKVVNENLLKAGEFEEAVLETKRSLFFHEMLENYERKNI